MSDKQVATTQERRRELRPLSSLVEENGVIVLSLEMPGVSKDGVDLEVEGSELRIRGRRSQAHVPGRFLLRERLDGDYREVYTLDETVDRSRIDGVVEDGVLTITMHLREAEKPRKIQITAH
jgi:HSP20 family protein